MQCQLLRFGRIVMLVDLCKTPVIMRIFFNGSGFTRGQTDVEKVNLGPFNFFDAKATKQ